MENITITAEQVQAVVEEMRKLDKEAVKSFVEGDGAKCRRISAEVEGMGRTLNMLGIDFKL